MARRRPTGHEPYPLSAPSMLEPVYHAPSRSGDRRAALAALVAHLPRLTAPGLVFGVSTPARRIGEGMTEMGHYTLGPEAVAFMSDVHAYGWVRDFNWMEWSQTAEGQRMLHELFGLENADEEGITRVLTVCMREAHWGSQALEQRFNEGLLVRIIERAATLLYLRN